jgi:hypothetical protein
MPNRDIIVSAQNAGPKRRHVTPAYLQARKLNSCTVAGYQPRFRFGGQIKNN